MLSIIMPMWAVGFEVSGPSLTLRFECRAERAQRLGRHGSDPPASPPRADPNPPSAKGGSFRREDGEIVGESPSTSKRHAEPGRQRAAR